MKGLEVEPVGTDEIRVRTDLEVACAGAGGRRRGSHGYTTGTC